MDPENRETTIALPERMAELREQHRHTQQECADALGISQSSYADMEGGRSRVRRRDLVTLAVLYGITLDQAFPTASAVEDGAAEKVG